MLPVVGASEAISFREEDNVLLVVDVGLSLVQPDLAIQYHIQAFRLFLFLIHKSFLSELGKEHGSADVVNSRKVLDLLDWLNLNSYRTYIQEDPGQGIDVSHGPLLRLTHEYLEH